MDELDRMLEEAAREREAKKAAPATELAAQQAKDAAARGAAERQAAREAQNAKAEAAAAAYAADEDDGGFVARLRAYIERLLDPEALEAVTATLARCTYATAEEYYTSRPELGAYTVEHELKRMDYTVTDASGRVLTAPTDIATLWRAQAAGDELLWRMANQSLLADLLGAVASSWAEAELCVAVKASRCGFALDLRPASRSLAVEASLSIQSVMGDEPLELATITVGVRVELAARTLRHEVGKPRLAECLVFEEQIAGVAASLARCARDAASGGASGGGGAAGGGGGGGEGGSLDDVAAQLARFMSDGDGPTAAATPESPQPPPAAAGAKPSPASALDRLGGEPPGAGSLLSGLWSAATGR